MPRRTPLYLPPEVVEIIIGYLTFEHPPTLLNFAKASRTYYACCRPAIKSIKFHDINLMVSSSKRQVEEAVNRLIKRLKAEDGLHFVRQLIIGYPTYEGEVHDWKPPRMSELRCNKPADVYTTQYGEWVECFEMERDTYCSWNSRSEPDLRAYKSVVKLIILLPRLKDLIWSRNAHVPLCIVEALRHDQPQCRLHLDGRLHICDLNTAKNPEDLAFITSPSIHSIKVSGGDACYNSILRLAGLAPNLKKVRMRRCPSFEGPALGSENFQSGTASLVDLRFEATWKFDERRLCEWSYCTDFSTLQTLIIHGRLNDAAFKVWDKMEFLFQSLKTLHLNIAGSRSKEFYDDASKFLRSLPPLTELEVTGWHLRIGIESLLSVHGSHLRKFTLRKPATWQTLSEHQIRQISRKCPLLEDLGVTIDGAQSHTEKAEIYAALGSMQNLKYLDLTYEVGFMGLPMIPREETTLSTGTERPGSQHHELPSYSSFDEFENKFCEGACDESFRLRNGHVQKMMVDGIMDERLACEVFQAILDAKTQNSPVLKDLIIKVIGAHVRKDLIDIVHLLSSDWRVIYETDFRRRGKLIAKEIESGRGDIGGRNRNLPLWLEPIFYRIFPAAKPKGPPRKLSKKLAAKRDKEKSQATPMWRRYIHSFPAASATEN